MRRFDPPDYVLIGILTLVFLIPLSFIDLFGDRHSPASSVYRLVGGNVRWGEVSGAFLCSLPLLAGPAFGLAYAVQSVIRRRGVRLSGKPKEQATRDYEERPEGDRPPAKPPDP